MRTCIESRGRPVARSPLVEVVFPDLAAWGAGSHLQDARIERPTPVGRGSWLGISRWPGRDGHAALVDPGSPCSAGASIGTDVARSGRGLEVARAPCRVRRYRQRRVGRGPSVAPAIQGPWLAASIGHALDSSVTQSYRSWQASPIPPWVFLGRLRGV